MDKDNIHEMLDRVEQVNETEPVIENVYQKIVRVIRILSTVGISKDQVNKQQSYKFRGIDDVYNALAPALSEVGLIILPEVTEREIVERQTKQGGALFYVTLRVKYHFVSADDSSSHIVVAYGEAMDTGDKATNKAMSAAYKYACFQAFCIPTEAQDADKTTHEVAPQTVETTVFDLNVSDFVEKIDSCFTTTITNGKQLVECQDEKGVKETIGELNKPDDGGKLKLAVWKNLESNVRAYIKDMEEYT